MVRAGCERGSTAMVYPQPGRPRRQAGSTRKAPPARVVEHWGLARGPSITHQRRRGLALFPGGVLKPTTVGTAADDRAEGTAGAGYVGGRPKRMMEAAPARTLVTVHADRPGGRIARAPRGRGRPGFRWSPPMVVFCVSSTAHATWYGWPPRRFPRRGRRSRRLQPWPWPFVVLVDMRRPNRAWFEGPGREGVGGIDRFPQGPAFVGLVPRTCLSGGVQARSARHLFRAATGTARRGTGSSGDPTASGGVGRRREVALPFVSELLARVGNACLLIRGSTTSGYPGAGNGAPSRRARHCDTQLVCSTPVWVQLYPPAPPRILALARPGRPFLRTARRAVRPAGVGAAAFGFPEFLGNPESETRGAGVGGSDPSAGPFLTGWYVPPFGVKNTPLGMGCLVVVMLRAWLGRFVLVVVPQHRSGLAEMVTVFDNSLRS